MNYREILFNAVDQVTQTRRKTTAGETLPEVRAARMTVAINQFPKEIEDAWQQYKRKRINIKQGRVQETKYVVVSYRPESIGSPEDVTETYRSELVFVNTANERFVFLDGHWRKQ